MSSSSGDIEVGGLPQASSFDDEPAGSDMEIEIGGLPGRAELGADSDADIEVSNPVAEPCKQPHARARKRRYLDDSGSFWAVAVTEIETANGECVPHVFGITKMQWDLAPPKLDEVEQQGCGRLSYTVQQCVMLQDPVGLAGDVDVGTDPTATLRALIACRDSLVDVGNAELKTITAFLLTQQARCETIVLCSPAEVDAMPGVFRTAIVWQRRPPHGVISGYPSKVQLRAWRAHVGREHERAACVRGGVPAPLDPERLLADPMLHLPSHIPTGPLDAGTRGARTLLGREWDPVRLVHAIGMAQHIKSPKYFLEVVHGAIEYLNLEVRQAPIEHDGTLDPKRTALDTALARADAVAMLLQRRMFKSWRWNKRIKSLHLQSDASPVAGHELQGMILDVVMNDGSMVRITLPGSTLAYGHTDTFSKGVAMLWALWLVAGPMEDDLRYCVDLVRSLTTDFGVEIHLLDMPDILPAFIAWVSGTPLGHCRALVNHNVRLFARAMRIAGWSHTLGNIMKAVGTAFPLWPPYLAHMRSLCSFFRISEYRRHIAKSLRDPPELNVLMKSFTAGFAKWRYETIVVVQDQLGALRPLCESYLNPAMFARAKDQVEIKAVFKACKDDKFWRWLVVSHREIFSRLETLRKWGMVCSCPDHEAERKASNYKKKINCPRSSGRTGERTVGFNRP